MAINEELDLADIDDFGQAIMQFGWHSGVVGNSTTNANGLYCVRCGGKRRMSIKKLRWEGGADSERALFGDEGGTPGLFALTCMQCMLRHDVLVHLGPDGPEIAIFSPERGGFSTLNTPENVKYYLDQAHRTESVGATSAAVAMYRSALEMLLFEQGYEEGMLDRKIRDLLADTTPPAWRDQIDPDYLNVMKNLGNAAIHPNNGEIEKQKVLDRALLLQLRAIFEELLDRVYERPAQEAVRKAKLKGTLESFSNS